jgi:hypothetical protein
MAKYIPRHARPVGKHRKPSLWQRFLEWNRNYDQHSGAPTSSRRTRRVTTMPDATHYTYRVAWSVEDGEHVATVAEFPSLSWLAPTPVEALAGLADVVRGA